VPLSTDDADGFAAAQSKTLARSLGPPELGEHAVVYRNDATALE
jgi:hypothetical protein